MEPEFQVHESHLPLWERTDWRYAFLMGGRGNGRSGTGSRFSASRLLGEEYTRGALMRAVHADIRTSSWAEINDRLTEQGIENAQGLRLVDNEMLAEYGQNSLRAHGFKASSGSLTARLKSLANYNFVWIEEAEEIGEDRVPKAGRLAAHDARQHPHHLHAQHPGQEPLDNQALVRPHTQPRCSKFLYPDAQS